MLSLLHLVALGPAGSAVTAACDASADVVVWGGTVCGVTASVAAARGNTTVLWLVNGTRLGGMTSGGLGGVDLSMSIGGLAGELLAPLGHGFEPHVAEQAMEAMITSAGSTVTVIRRTGWLASVATSGSAPRRIDSATALDGRTYCGRVFIDCSYEGDLTRLSGTKYAVGREAIAEYNESMAGDDTGWRVGNETEITEKASFFAPDVSPWADSSNTTLLPTVTGVENATKPGGQADGKVMAMCFRMCLTNNASNLLPIDAPPGYTSRLLELLRRELVSASKRGLKLQLRSLFLVRHLSNQKIDLNSGQWSTQAGTGGYFPFSTDLPFAQYGWPLGNPSERASIFAAHKFWTQSILFYLGNDPQLTKIQPELVAEVKSYGLCADEYPDEPDRWTPQLYLPRLHLSGKIRLST